MAPRVSAVAPPDHNRCGTMFRVVGGHLVSTATAERHGNQLDADVQERQKKIDQKEHVGGFLTVVDITLGKRSALPIPWLPSQVVPFRLPGTLDARH